MAKVETRRQLFLTSEEIETLLKAKTIFFEIQKEDRGGEIFCQADNYDSEWDWIIYFIDNLICNSERE